jgi:hypothetical protein
VCNRSRFVVQQHSFRGQLFHRGEGNYSAGLGLTGVGVRIGQVERGRPGDADNGDTAGNRNSTTNPFDVFIQNNPGNPMPDAE